VLKRPSSRRKSHQEGIELNLVPILDTMVTLIGFLLFTTSFLAIASIESPLPQSSPVEVQEEQKEKPLQLTLTVKEKEAELWSPFGKIPSKVIPHQSQDQPDTKSIHEALIEVKKQFPLESTIVIVPTSATLYDQLISLMDSFRTLEPTDPQIYSKNEKTGIDAPVKELFPKIVFGNLLGDN
jgi:biopolymer transport protein ExbD